MYYPVYILFMDDITSIFYIYKITKRFFFFLTTLGDLFLFLSWILFVYFFAFIFLLSQDCIKNKLQGKQEFSVYYFHVFFFKYPRLKNTLIMLTYVFASKYNF
jgi:hypothetical protein